MNSKKVRRVYREEGLGFAEAARTNQLSVAYKLAHAIWPSMQNS